MAADGPAMPSSRPDSSENSCGPHTLGVRATIVRAGCQAQLPPTAESVLDMLLPAVCTFWPWLLACS